jgi:hypothetical protein
MSWWFSDKSAKSIRKRYGAIDLAWGRCAGLSNMKLQ